MMERIFMPVGGTGGGPSIEPFRIELWQKILTKTQNKKPKIALLTTPSKLSDSINTQELLNNHKNLESQLNCEFEEIDETLFANDYYDKKFDILCITCGNTQEARNLWKSINCEQKIKNWYNQGIIITGYSAGFIVFFEWASTDSIAGPEGATFGAMPCMGILQGGAIPHIDTQDNRISDFQKVLLKQDISPVLALGEETLASFRNETLTDVFSPLKMPQAFWVEKGNLIQIEVKPL